MKTLQMAWRNLLRQKRRTLITLSALIVGLCGVVVFQGYVTSLMRSFRDSTILSGVGHLQIAQSAGYFDDGEFNPYAYVLKDFAPLLRELRREPGVLAVFPSTGFTSIAGMGDKSVTLLVKGYPAERMYFAPAQPQGRPAQQQGRPAQQQGRPAQQQGRPAQQQSGPAQQQSREGPPRDRFGLGTLISGSAPSPQDHDRIILGETAARILGAQPGSVVTLMAVLPDGGLNGRDFTVQGIYRDPGRDKVFAFTDFATAVDFTGLRGADGEPAAPVVHVLARDVGAVDAIRMGIPRTLAVRTWHDLATYFVQVNTMFSGFLGVIRAIILLVTLFIMANTMNRIVRERMREWGTLRAMGMKKNRILLLVMLEGGLHGVVGAALGVLLGFGVSALLNLHGGLPVPFANGGQRVVVRLLLSGQSFWNLAPAGLFAAAASFFPGLRAVRLTPSECLRQI